MKYSASLSNLFINLNEQMLISQGDLSSDESLPTTTLKTEYIATLSASIPNLVLIWREYVAESFRIGNKRSVFRLMNERIHVFYFGRNFDSLNLAGISSVPTGFPLLPYKDTVLNAGVLMSSQI